MPRFALRFVLSALVMGVTVGCTKSVVQQNKQPPDPLLVSKKPVDAKPMAYSRELPAGRVDVQPTAEPTYSIGNRLQGTLSSDVVVTPGR